MGEVVVGIFRWIVGIIVVLLIAVYFFWKTVPHRVSSFLTQQAKVKIVIKDIDLSFHTLTVKNLSVGNTAGSILPSALRVNQTTISAPLRSYFKDIIVIEELVLDDIYLGLEFDSAKGASGNWTEIMRNLQKASEQDDTGKVRKVLIKTVILKDINAEMVFRKGDQRIKRLPSIQQIVLHNISSEGKSLSLELMNSVLGQMLQNVFVQENIKNMLEGVINIPGKTLDKVLSPLDIFK
jgi:hypothetical protein